MPTSAYLNGQLPKQFSEFAKDNVQQLKGQSHETKPDKYYSN
jgi:hypothetical protein